MHPDTRSLLVCSRVLLLVSLVGCALSARAGTGAKRGEKTCLVGFAPMPELTS